MEAKLKVTFEPSVVSPSEIERKLKVIKDLPIRVVSHNVHENLDELNMEVLFGEDKTVSIRPIGDTHVCYTNLENIKDCYIDCTSTGINIRPTKSSENYNFFYKKKE